MHRLFVAIVLCARVAYAQPASEPTPPPPADGSAAEPAPLAPAAPVPASPPAPAPAAAIAIVPPEPPKPESDDWKMRLGGFVQPQFRMRQDSPVPNDEDGFRFARARLTATAEGRAGDLRLSAFFETELQPTFALIDAFATASQPLANKGVITVDAGQTRVPISRQQLISDSRLSFVDRAQLATIAPDRDLGLRLWFVPPGLPQLRVIGGVFNGEGKNQIQNINESYLYAGRVEVTPFGAPAPHAESAFAPEPWLSVAASAGHNSLTPGDYHERVLFLGADVSGAYHGLSGSVEFLQVKHTYDGDPMKFPGPEYKGQGWMAQLAYLLPIELPPAQHTRLEVAGRIEEIDRNDTVPIPVPGDPAQSVREYTAVLSAYVRQHLLKVQIAFNHFQEVETKTSTGLDATYPNDQLVVQLTYRVE